MAQISVEIFTYLRDDIRLVVCTNRIVCKLAFLILFTNGDRTLNREEHTARARMFAYRLGFIEKFFS